MPQRVADEPFEVMAGFRVLNPLVMLNNLRVQ
jgi:hypothetical protein